MNIQQLALGTLAAIATADLSPEASVSPSSTSLTLTSQTSDVVPNTKALSSGEIEPIAESITIRAKHLPLDTGKGEPVAVERHNLTFLQTPDNNVLERGQHHFPGAIETADFDSLATQMLPETHLIDVRGHWAQAFIEALQAQGIVRGFPDGSFRPDTLMTRAHFAAVLQQAFPNPSLVSGQTLGSRSAASYADVPNNYWAQAAIEAALQMQLLEGYSNRIVAPNEPISRLQVLLALVKGLHLEAEATTAQFEAYFPDAAAIPDSAKDSLGGAMLLMEKLEQHRNAQGVTAANKGFLNPDRLATRAEVATFIYLALDLTQHRQSVAEIPTVSENTAEATGWGDRLPDAGSDYTTSRMPFSIAETEPNLSLFPPAPDERISSLVTPVERNDDRAQHGQGGTNLLNSVARKPNLSLNERKIGNTGDERFEGNRLRTGNTEAAGDRLPDRNRTSHPLATASTSSRSHANWETREQLLESATRTESLPSRAVAPTSSEAQAQPLENSLSVRLDLLRERIQSRREIQQNLPPLAAAGTYLPEVQEIFQGYVWPARGVFTSGFGMRWGRMHQGIDIAAPIGTPVIAAGAGVVTYARWNSGGYGNLVEIQHHDGTVTRYAHNHRILVKEGDVISQGQLIAEVGSTGNSTGPHLHFEIYPPGQQAVDPLAYLPGDPRTVRINSVVGQAVP